MPSKKAAKPAPKAATPRAESKGAKILEMIARAKGATLAEIMKATDRQAHSVRGFISTAGKKHGMKIESAKNDAGERTYRTSKLPSRRLLSFFLRSRRVAVRRRMHVARRHERDSATVTSQD
jgi:hypothetical protein